MLGGQIARVEHGPTSRTGKTPILGECHLNRADSCGLDSTQVLVL